MMHVLLTLCSGKKICSGNKVSETEVVHARLSLVHNNMLDNARPCVSVYKIVFVAQAKVAQVSCSDILLAMLGNELHKYSFL